MLDYKLLEALAAVVDAGGFDKAGDMLGISQSAISQRIRTLEVRLGQPVLVRSQTQEQRPQARDCSIMFIRCACWNAT